MGRSLPIGFVRSLIVIEDDLMMFDADDGGELNFELGISNCPWT